MVSLRSLAATGAAAFLFVSSAAAQRVVQPPLDTPTITCGTTTQATIEITVCAGPSGAPAGFSLQWVKVSDLSGPQCDGSGTWPDSSSGLICKASFSGVPGCSIYNLGPGEWVTVEVGNLLDSECGVGLSDCGADELECGSEYVFRAFAHNVPGGRKKSAFTDNLCCSTVDCGDGCTFTQGFWGNHACEWPSPFVPGDNGTAPVGQCGSGGANQQCAADQLNTIPIGDNSYTQLDLLCNLARPGQGNALLILSHQLIAAELNVLNGAGVPPAVAIAIAQAHALIDGLDINTGFVASQSDLGQQMIAVKNVLDDYNNGGLGVSHCP